ncbi:RidA family protein [Mycolicibacterium palauense]|uniref:RidA family protein n=1 Tax=Mycolicibacterium palauense TaxID=2034511 RepID=UPI000BFED64C|nr:RidA family protein [Mycolicibacterium palauense]
MTISYSNPDVGYLDQTAFKNLGFTQNVWADDTLYLSGIAPFTGGDPEFVVHGIGSMKEQTVFILDVLKKLLEAEDLTYANLVALTIYATSAKEYFEVVPLIVEAFGDQAPSQTLVGVTELAHPEQRIEITAIAVRS